MRREPRRGRPEILARLRHEVERRSESPTAPRWARAAGLLITAGIVVVIIVAILRANPL